MRIALSIFAIAAFLNALAFDSDLWLGKRAEMDAVSATLRESYAKCVDAMKTPAENVAVPFENWPNGSVKSSLTAEKAQFFMEEGLVWGEGVIVRQFDEKGHETAKLEAENCIVDRNTRMGWVEGKAKLKYGKTTINGEKIFFSLSDEYIKIYSNVEINSSDLKMEGVKL